MTENGKPSTLRRVFRGCLILALLIVLIGVGIYVAIQTELITLNDLVASLAGLSDIGALNLTESTHLFYVATVSSEDGDASQLRTYNLSEFGSASVGVLPGTYRVEIYESEEDHPFFVDEPPVAVCEFDLSRNSDWLFVIAPDGVLINAGEDESDLAEFYVSTSSLCGN